MSESISFLYFKQTDKAHRQSFGQFFTPSVLASFMTEWVLSSRTGSLYDPAFGLGAFYDNIDSTVNYSGMELDPDLLSFYYSHRSAPDITQGDYLLSWGLENLGVVCNPPYGRFQLFPNRHDVSAEFEKHGVKLSGYTNVASAFLLKSLMELQWPGRLAYLMPLEFLSAGYGEAVKSHLLKHPRVMIIRLLCEQEIFPDASTTLGLVMCDTASDYRGVEFYSLSSLADLSSVLDGSPDNAVESPSPKSNWLRFFDREPFSLSVEKTLPIGYYGVFTRGIATGANKFFVLRRSEQIARGIPDEDTLPILSRSSQSPMNVFTDSDYDALLRADGQVILFNPVNGLSSASADYVQYGSTCGFDKGYITRNRRLWYVPEHRPPYPIWLTTFSRNGFRVVRNRTQVRSLTSFHGFQPTALGLPYVDSVFLFLSSSVGQDSLQAVSRTYGRGLQKVEPGDLHAIRLPHPDVFDQLSEDDVKRGVDSLRSGAGVPQDIEGFFEELR